MDVVEEFGVPFDDWDITSGARPAFQARRLRAPKLINDDRLSVAEWMSQNSGGQVWHRGDQPLGINVSGSGHSGTSSASIQHLSNRSLLQPPMSAREHKDSSPTMKAQSSMSAREHSAATPSKQPGASGLLPPIMSSRDSQSRAGAEDNGEPAPMTHLHPLSPELERRKRRHPRLRWRKFIRPDLLKGLDLNVGTGIAAAPEGSRHTEGQEEDHPQEEDDASKPTSRFEKPTVIEEGSVFFPGVKVTVEPPRQTLQRADGSSSPFVEESQRTGSRRLVSARRTENSLRTSTSGDVHLEERDRACSSAYETVVGDGLVDKHEHQDHHPHFPLLPQRPLWTDVLVGSVATFPVEPSSLQANGELVEEDEDLDARLLQDFLRRARKSGFGCGRSLAPFSHVIARDIAQGRPVRGVPTVPVRTQSRETNVRLHFKGWGLDDSYVQCLCSRIPLRAVKVLNLPDNRLTDSCIDFLAEKRLLANGDANERWSSLEELSLPDNRLLETGGEAVARLINVAQPALVKLDLSGNQLNDRGCEVLCDALMRKCHSSLQELSLSGNSIGANTSAGVAIGDLLVVSSRLEQLKLQYNLLHGPGALAVCQGILGHYGTSKPRLAIIDLSWNRLGMRCVPAADPWTAQNEIGAASVDQRQQQQQKQGSQPRAQSCTCMMCSACSRIVKACESIVIEGLPLTDFNLSYNGLRPDETEVVSRAAKRRLETPPTLQRFSSHRGSAKPADTTAATRYQALRSLQLHGNLPTARARTPDRATSVG